MIGDGSSLLPIGGGGGGGGGSDDVIGGYGSLTDDVSVASTVERNKTVIDDSVVSKGSEIGLVGGVCLLVNSMTGPAIIGVPQVAHSAGWLPLTICVALVWCISTFCAVKLTQAMSFLAPSHGRLELASIIRLMYGRRMFITILTILNICLVSLNIASIIASSQAIDLALAQMFQKACALEFSPHPSLSCTRDIAHDSSTPFDDNSYILSLGAVMVLCIIIPLGYVNLTDNIIVQEVACGSIIAMVILWSVDLMAHVELHGELHAVGASQSYTVGQVMFNFVVAICVPSWFNEKAPSVNATVSVAASTFTAAALFLYVGLLGALAFAFSDTGSADLVTKLSACDECYWITRLSAYLLPVCAFLSSIPVYSIIIQKNVLDNKLCSKPVAFMCAVVVPWMISIPFYNGKGLLTLINWAALFLQSFINFILPCVVVLQMPAFVAAQVVAADDDCASPSRILMLPFVTRDYVLCKVIIAVTIALVCTATALALM